MGPLWFSFRCSLALVVCELSTISFTSPQYDNLNGLFLCNDALQMLGSKLLDILMHLQMQCDV